MEYKGFKVEKWDGKSPVNGQPPEVLFKENPLLTQFESFLFSFNGQVLRVEMFNTLRANDPDMREATDGEIMETFLKSMADGQEEQKRMSGFAIDGADILAALAEVYEQNLEIQKQLNK